MRRAVLRYSNEELRSVIKADFSPVLHVLSYFAFLRKMSFRECGEDNMPANIPMRCSPFTNHTCGEELAFGAGT